MAPRLAAPSRPGGLPVARSTRPPPAAVPPPRRRATAPAAPSPAPRPARRAGRLPGAEEHQPRPRIDLLLRPPVEQIVGGREVVAVKVEDSVRRKQTPDR